MAHSILQTTSKTTENVERHLFILRHGERMDFAFPNWRNDCFDADGFYKRTDLNQPMTLQKRSDFMAYHRDGPLTRVGRTQAFCIGEAFKECGIQISHVYCSPSLRCVETSSEVLKGLGVEKQIPICVEPGLFEYLGWYPLEFPSWMSIEEFRSNGLNVASLYWPVVGANELKENHLTSSESMKEFYSRQHKVTETILGHSAGNVLIVGHAITLDGCSRLLMGKEPRAASEVSPLVKQVPYCSLLTLGCIKQPNDSTFEWKTLKPTVLPFTCQENPSFDNDVLE